MILKLNKEIYSQKAVFRAIKAYKNLANFKLNKKGKYFTVNGTTKLENKELLKNEFLNFVLANIKR